MSALLFHERLVSTRRCQNPRQEANSFARHLCCLTGIPPVPGRRPAQIRHHLPAKANQRTIHERSRLSRAAWRSLAEKCESAEIVCSFASAQAECPHTFARSACSPARPSGKMEMEMSDVG